MAKRGMEIEALHFESFPYTSERALEKVMTLAQEMCEFISRIHVHVISLTHIQEELRDNCKEDYFTILLRVFMMRLAERCAREYKCQALITGESLGQVASQTMEAMASENLRMVKPAYYEIALKRKYMSDPIAWDMLDLIFQHRTYDMAMYFTTLGFGNLFADAVKSTGDNFSSKYASASKSFDRKIATILRKLQNSR